ncbi:MAG: phage minor head protein, partial [Nevskiales bacterium]
MAEPRLQAVQPAEAIAFFRAKGYKIGFDWRDVYQAEHQNSFTVAKAMQIELLQDIRGELQKSLADGTTFEQFQTALKPKLVARGWWGRAQMTDPKTGETKEVQLGSTRRLKT